MTGDILRFFAVLILGMHLFDKYRQARRKFQLHLGRKVCINCSGICCLESADRLMTGSREAAIRLRAGSEVDCRYPLENEKFI